MDTKSKFIDKFKVTDTSVHDSQPMDDLLCKEDKGKDFYADSAYTGVEQEKVIDKYKINNKVNEKGYHNKPLTDEQKRSHREKSKTRARVEHVFDFMEQSIYLVKSPIKSECSPCGMLAL
jgi:IS5 family transposase